MISKGFRRLKSRGVLFRLFSAGLLLLTSAAFGQTKQNVLLVSIDTLRSDHLGAYGYSGKTPAIDSLASRGALFESAVSQVPLTLPSHSTILTGLFPGHHGVRNNESFVLPEKITTLAEQFRGNGYATGAVVGSFSLDSVFGIHQGFEFYEDRIGKGKDPVANRHVERRAEIVWKLGKSWLLQQKKPWFCFLHFFDPHTAYAPPKPYPQTYDGEISYVDSQIQEIIRFMDEHRLWPTTILVILSDHGESLGEHGESSHGVFVYDSTVRVPLMILAPGIKPIRIPYQVRLADVAPTLAALSGLKDQPEYDGQNLIPWMQGKGKELLAYSESYYTNLLMGWAPLFSIRSSKGKWIDAPKPELYDLIRDPREIKNLYAANRVPAEFRTELSLRSKSVMDAASPESIDPETKEKLASLGYITGSSTKSISTGFDPKDGISAWTQIEEAVIHAQMGDLEKSKTIFLEVLRQQPGNVIAHKFLAGVLRKKGDYGQAIEQLKLALDSPLHREETATELAEVYYDAGQNERALEQSSSIVRTDPGNLRAQKLAGYASLQLKKYAESSSYFSAALKMDPEDVEILSLQARVLSHLDKDSEALQLYQRLAKLRPLSESEALQAAGIFLTQRNVEQAEAYFHEVLKQNESSTPAWKGLALIYASKGQWKDATGAFLQAGDCAGAKVAADKMESIPPDIAGQIEEKCN